MTTEQKMAAIEENYINGNIQDAIKLFKKLPVAQRKEFAINAMYITNSQDADIIRKQYAFASFLIENI